MATMNYLPQNLISVFEAFKGDKNRSCASYFWTRVDSACLGDWHLSLDAYVCFDQRGYLVVYPVIKELKL